MGKNIKTKADFEELIEKSREEKAVWQLANGILYDLCKKHPLHKKRDEVIAKVWLIGRSYAASLERGRETNDSSDNFYEGALAKAVKSHAQR